MKNKNKRLLKRLLIIVFLVILILIAYIMFAKKSTFADSGFGVSYDSGGGSSSYSSGSSSSGNSEWISSLNFSTKIMIALMMWIPMIICIISDVRYTNKRNKHNIKDRSLIVKEIKQYIPNFNTEEFLNKGYNIYCKVQQAWMNFKLEDVKDIITDELYNMYEAQLETLKAKEEQNIMKDFMIITRLIEDSEVQNNTITITTNYIISFYDYIIKQSTGKVIRGTDKSKVTVIYEMKFRKSLNTSNKITKCPNCGADIEMNTSEVCGYCHTKLVTENTEWVLTEKKIIKQYLNK